MSVASQLRSRPASERAQLACAGFALLALSACQLSPSAAPTALPSTITCTPCPPPLPTTSPSSTTTSDDASITAISSSTPSAETSDQPPPFPTPTSTPDQRLDARHWRQWEIVPTLNPNGREILALGLTTGVDSQAFSTIGDCQSMPAVFMGMYDRPGTYLLGEGYGTLQQTIDYFAGSFSRVSVTVHNGMNVATVFSPLWADPALCLSGETPLECEFRLHHPAVVFVNLGTNSIPGGASSYEHYLRQIVEFSTQHGALPILSTKADNLEEDFSLNEATARVAYDYDLPLWNFWRAVQPLPHHGLDAHRDGNYLSTEAWGVRSFTGLQTLQAVLQAMQDLPGVSTSAGNGS